jgi:hypothetical protein
MQLEDFFPSWSLCFEDSTSFYASRISSTLYASFPFVWVLQKLCLTSRSYLMITTMWHPLSCSASSYSFLYLLTLVLNRRSRIVLDISTWNWPLTQDPFYWTLFVNGKTLTQYGFPFKLAVAVVIELRQQGTFPSTCYGRGSLMEPKGSWQEFSVWVSSLSPWLLPHPSFQHWFTWDVNLCIQI